MTFAHPHLLWMLLVLPPGVAAFFWWDARRRRALLQQFINTRLLPGLLAGVSPGRRQLRVACLLLAVACLIIALARPQWGFSWEEVKQRGLDIIVAIDTSKSMLADDIAPNRLARAQLAALDLMQQAKSDRLGLVAFAGVAFLQCPLTIDDVAFRQSVETLNVNIIPQGGTAIAEAIDTALTAFKEGDNHKALVLFTDGEDHDSGAIEAAKKAAQAGMKIFTIGIGSVEGTMVRVKDQKGGSDYVRDPEGNVVKSRLNEGLLQQIATEAGGFYLPLRGAKAIDTLYEKGLAPLPKTEGQEKLVKRYHEQYGWPLGLAILLLMAEMLLPDRKREARPGRAAPVNALKAGAAAMTVLLLLAAPSASWASSGRALRDYQNGRYEESLREYERLLQRHSDDPRFAYNAGTAAYRAKEFDAAAKHFGEALKGPDLRLQESSYYNRGNSLYRLGELVPDMSKKKQFWEKSLKDFELALKLNPSDADAKNNLEFVKQSLAALEQMAQQQQQDKQEPPPKIEPSEAAKKAKAEADKAVAQKQFARGLEIMETQLKADPTTEFYRDFIQRLRIVNTLNQ